MFRELKKNNLTEEIITLFLIFKAIIGLNSDALIEFLVFDDVCLDVFEILECTLKITLDDPETYRLERAHNFRRHVEERVTFINAAKIKNKDILCAIHYIFHLIFLREVAAVTWLDQDTDIFLKNVDNLLPLAHKRSLRGCIGLH